MTGPPPVQPESTAQVRPAKWDRLDALDTHKPPIPGPLMSAADLRAKALARTRLLDRVVHDIQTHAPEIPAVCTQLRLDLKSRVVHWRLDPHAPDGHPQLIDGRASSRGVYVVRAVVSLVLLAMLAVAYSLLTSRTPMPKFVLVGAGIVVVLVVLGASSGLLALVVGLFLRHAGASPESFEVPGPPPQTWMFDAFRRRLCPDCAYDLASLPDAIAPEPLGGLHVGPARCPECGASWPLIPPPLPALSTPTLPADGGAHDRGRPA